MYCGTLSLQLSQLSVLYPPHPTSTCSHPGVRVHVMNPEASYLNSLIHLNPPESKSIWVQLSTF